MEDFSENILELCSTETSLIGESTNIELRIGEGLLYMYAIYFPLAPSLWNPCFLFNVFCLFLIRSKSLQIICLSNQEFQSETAAVFCYLYCILYVDPVEPLDQT